MTMRDQYAAGLKAAGYVQIETTKTAWVFRKIGCNPEFIWLGANGSVRGAGTKCKASSIPASPSIKASIIARGNNTKELS